jgi:hypothetical protein
MKTVKLYVPMANHKWQFRLKWRDEHDSEWAVAHSGNQLSGDPIYQIFKSIDENRMY